MSGSGDPTNRRGAGPGDEDARDGDTAPGQEPGLDSAGVPFELVGADPADDAREASPRRWPRILIWCVALLVATALALYGLVPLLRSSPEPRPTPGPLPELESDTVEAFGAQQPIWEPCGDGVQCSDVYAPVRWDEPGEGRITLRLVKRPATGSDRIGTLFVNPGGPGASGADYVRSLDGAVSEDLQRRYDVIGWDPRGVGASTPVRCLDAAGLDEYLFGEPDPNLEVGSDAWIEAASEEAAAFGEACAAETGEVLGFVDTMSTVHDLDMLRSVVGDERLNYLGYSYGTYIGARYADAFPERVGRMVLDGAMDPASTMFDVVRTQTLGFEAALRSYLEDCLGRKDCPFLRSGSGSDSGSDSVSVDDAMERIGDLLESVEQTPLNGSDGRVLSAGTLLTAIITPLYSQDAWPALDQMFVAVAGGDADPALRLADFYYDREDGQYLDNSTEAFSAINCLDYPGVSDRELMRAQAQELAEIAPTIGPFQGFGDVSCAAWPYPGAAERGPVSASGADPILVVGTTGDPATPYRWAESLAAQLESGRLVTYEGEGHTAYGQSDCVGSVVDAYLLEGETPSGDPRCS